MKVVHISTYDTIGGAAIAAYRVAKAIEAIGVEINIVVKEQQSNDKSVFNINPGLGKHLGFANFALEKAHFLFYEKSKEFRFQYSTSFFGQDISKLSLLKEAEIIHLHWTNHSFLSINDLQKIFQLGKPVVWTLHDMWAFTGGCHYVGDCRNFEKECGNCNYLKKPAENDISHQIWKRKKSSFPSSNFQIVTSSVWLSKEAKASSLFGHLPIKVIPTPIDAEVFRPIQAHQKKEKYTILFQAMNINDKRKGLRYLIESLRILKKNNPEFANQVRLLIFGKNNSDALSDIDYEVIYLGKLSGDQAIAEAFNQCDIFVIPTLEDNLPNTVLESLSCCKPVVTFNTGGVPDMVTHKETGYIVPQRDAEGLAEGIFWTLNNQTNYSRIAENARKKVLTDFSYDKVGKQYLELYNSLLK